MNNINNTINKEKLREEFYWKIRAELRTGLNAKNKVIAINTLAIPIMTILAQINKILKILK